MSPNRIVRDACDYGDTIEFTYHGKAYRVDPIRFVGTAAFIGFDHADYKVKKFAFDKCWNVVRAGELV